ncbi:dTDP-4-dehydrorhamnose reductase [Marinobacterium lacunae]|uniref:dTDP-4-dehydrorhamnose reductase n=1 Tax=Marinobacterium lacunae TaxID=1232683 RepID=A0A081G148_9GAMM|nr:dTDP-4-dehydrorhamnose reductase [Marinobacterium lacunae]KEA64503.1 dTDP-4-dehydrorhamnose reductase [Marinobacterium lacunae]MBR9882410.1 dTDP-4-dehydrorhamnose reductase [Oceanospirillales bacterium]
MSANPFAEPSRILITGAQGQIGRALVSLLERDPDFIVTACSRRQLDITNKKQLADVLAEVLPDYVVNCAGFNRVDPAEQDPQRAYAVNAEGVAGLAAMCGEMSIPLLHLSSDYVFDGHYASGYKESDEAAPLGIYGDSKWQGEEHIRRLLPRHIILRVSWIFSACGTNFLLRTLEQARHEPCIQAVDDRRGCPTSSQDVARVLSAILKQLANGAEAWGTYHYCGAEITTRYGFSEAILAAARQYEELAVEELLPVSSRDMPEAAERPASSVLKCNKLLNTFGIRQRPWRSELQRLVRELYGERALEEPQSRRMGAGDSDQVAQAQ